MNREIVTAIKSREVGERLAALGYDAAASSPEQLAEHMKVELARYDRLIKAIGSISDHFRREFRPTAMLLNTPKLLPLTHPPCMRNRTKGISESSRRIEGEVLFTGETANRSNLPRAG